MSAGIGIEYECGTISAIFCREDFFPEVAQTLLASYRTARRVQKLIALGNIYRIGSQVGPTSPDVQREQWTLQPNRLCQREPPTSQPATACTSRNDYRQLLGARGATKFYLLLAQTNQWCMSTAKKDKWELLANVVSDHMFVRGVERFPMADHDLIVERSGPNSSIVFVRGATEAGRDWLEEHTAIDVSSSGFPLAYQVNEALELLYLAQLDGLRLKGVTTSHSI